MFMNAGDRFAAPDSLARMAAALRASPGVDLLFGGTILALPSGRTWYRPPRPIARLRFGLPACHQATVIRRAAHLLAPYDLSLPVSADYGTIATLISRGATQRPARPARSRSAPAMADGLSERATADASPTSWRSSGRSSAWARSASRLRRAPGARPLRATAMRCAAQVEPCPSNNQIMICA